MSEVDTTDGLICECGSAIPMHANSNRGFYCFCFTCKKAGSGASVKAAYKAFLESTPGDGWYNAKETRLACC